MLSLWIELLSSAHSTHHHDPRHPQALSSAVLRNIHRPCCARDAPDGSPWVEAIAAAMIFAMRPEAMFGWGLFLLITAGFSLGRGEA